MTELRGFDFDGETSRAWRAFAGRLADHLADMEDGDTLEIGLVGLPSEAPGSGTSSVSFTGCEDSLVRAAVTVIPASVGETSQPAADEAASHEQRPSIEELLGELGWREPGPPPASAEGRQTTQPATFHGEQIVPRREADQLSSRTVRLLCEVLGAVHPVFLHVSGDRDLVDRSPEGHPIADLKDLEPPWVTEPRDSAQLRELVGQTIASDLGEEPTRDSDGDIVLEVGTTRVFIRVLENTPVISVFGRLLHDVAHPYEAPAVVAKLNAEYSFVKFIFGADSIVACVHLPASPFVPAQLRRMVATFGELADSLDDELVRRLGGWREIEPDLGELDDDDDLPEGFPPELVTLLRLDPDGVGLDPQLTARICGYDRALTRQLLHIAGGQETVWRRAAESGEHGPDDEAKAFDEAAGWNATRQSLAQALELIDSPQH